MSVFDSGKLIGLRVGGYSGEGEVVYAYLDRGEFWGGVKWKQSQMISEQTASSTQGYLGEEDG